MRVLERVLDSRRCGNLGRIALLLTASVVIVILVLASASYAGRKTTMYRMEPRAHRADDGVTQDQIRRSVIEILERRGWTVHVRTAGVVEADISISKGKHRATIAVVFDDKNFAVRYVSSYDLGYSGASCRDGEIDEDGLPSYLQGPAKRMRRHIEAGCVGEVIHPSYNEWVQQIEEEIARNVPRLGPSRSAAAVPPATSDSVSEAVRKLDALHAAGLLTAEEVEAHKRLLPGVGALATDAGRAAE